MSSWNTLQICIVLTFLIIFSHRLTVKLVFAFSQLIGGWRKAVSYTFRYGKSQSGLSLKFTMVRMENVLGSI